MAFYIRKSFRMGPLRLNLSKGGLGASVGVTGARVGLTPGGRAYVHAGRGGVYSRHYLGTVSDAKPRRVSSGTVTLYEDTGVTYPSGARDPDRRALAELQATASGDVVWPYLLLGAASLPVFALALGAESMDARLLLLGFGLATLLLGAVPAARILRRRRARERLHALLIRSVAAARPLSDRALGQVRAALDDRWLSAGVRETELSLGYLAAARRIVDDGFATPQEMELLEQLEETFDLDPERCTAARVDAFRGVWLQAVADHELTVDEEENLAALREALRIPASAIAEELALVESLAELRLIREGRLPVVEPAHPLRPGERCHFEGSARLLRERNLRTFQREGRRYRVRGLVVDREGTLLVTDRRILLVHSGTTSIPLRSIVDVEVDLDRSLVRIVRDDVKGPTLFTTPDAELAGAVIAGAAGA